jgi:hypothetical protein
MSVTLDSYNNNGKLRNAQDLIYMMFATNNYMKYASLVNYCTRNELNINDVVIGLKSDQIYKIFGVYTEPCQPIKCEYCDKIQYENRVVESMCMKGITGDFCYKNCK